MNKVGLALKEVNRRVTEYDQTGANEHCIAYKMGNERHNLDMSSQILLHYRGNSSPFWKAQPRTRL